MRWFLIIVLCLSTTGFEVYGEKRQRTSFERGRRAFENGKYNRALRHLSDAITKAETKADKTYAYYYQGLTLFEKGLYYSSYLSFRNVLLHRDKRIKQMYEKAIKNAVVILDRLGMADRVGKILAKLPPSFIAPSVSHMANYAIGANAVFSNQFAKAEGHLKAVHPESQFYLKSLFYLGVISTKKKRYKDAAFYFNKVIKRTRNKRKERDLHELAKLNYARTVYAIGDVDKAIDIFSQFTNRSKLWIKVLLEASWPLMRVNDTTISLGNLHTLTSPFYHEHMVGEAYYLRATTLYSLCKYEEMRRTLADFYRLYNPVLAKMQKEQARYKGKKAFYLAYLKKRLNKSFMNYARADQGLRRLAKVIKTLRKEKRRLAKFQRNEQMKRMRTLIGRAETAVISEMDLAIRRLHTRQFEELQSHRDQMNYLKVQIETGEKDLISSNKGLPAKRIVDVETEVAGGFLFWPFEGEYWKDELGAYIYTTTSACLR